MNRVFNRTKKFAFEFSFDLTHSHFGSLQIHRSAMMERAPFGAQACYLSFNWYELKKGGVDAHSEWKTMQINYVCLSFSINQFAEYDANT